MKIFICMTIIYFCLLPYEVQSQDYYPDPEIISVESEAPLDGHEYRWHTKGYPDPYGHCSTDQEFNDWMAADPANHWGTGPWEPCQLCSKDTFWLTTINDIAVCVKGDCEYGYKLASYNGNTGCVKCPYRYDFKNGVCEWAGSGEAPGPPRVSLGVYSEGDGKGTITGPGIDCGTDCREEYPKGTQITLTAIPEEGSYLSTTGYLENGSNECSGNTCTISMATSQYVSFVFSKNPTVIYTGTTGNGTGMVVSTQKGSDSGNGITCGSDCWEEYFNGTTKVELEAVPDDGSIFESWEGPDCSNSTGKCIIPLTGVHSAYAVFTHPTLYTYNESWSQTGSGTIRGPGISCCPMENMGCVADCSEQYDTNPVLGINLTADPEPGSVFTGWYGDCSGTGPCRVDLLREDLHVGATFDRDDQPSLPEFLFIRPGGSGSGTVTGTPGWINCRSGNEGVCYNGYSPWTRVTLRATADQGSIFTGWSSTGSSDLCPGTGDCTVTVLGVVLVKPQFDRDPNFPLPPPPGQTAGASTNPDGPFLLFTPRLGRGSGTVTSSPGGIECGVDCTNLYSPATAVTLTATPNAGSAFTGWTGGGCSGLRECTVIMNNDMSIAATFIEVNIVPLISPLLLSKFEKAPGKGCGDRMVYECDTECVPQTVIDDWLGNGLCDDGTATYGINLKCEAFSNDNGDCSASGGGDGSTSPGISCGDGRIYDCVGSCVSESTATSWTGDGDCDTGRYGIDLRCDAFNNDDGDCSASQIGQGIELR